LKSLRIRSTELARVARRGATTFGSPSRVIDSGDTPKKKVDSAIRIFDTAERISYPEYLTRAVTFGT